MANARSVGRAWAVRAAGGARSVRLACTTRALVMGPRATLFARTAGVGL